MQRKLISFLFPILIVLLLTSSVRATPLIYKFTGEVTNLIYTPGTGSPALIDYMNNHNSQVGSRVYFTALVDFSVDPIGKTDPAPPNFFNIDYFYAQYLNGSSPTANINPILFNAYFGYGVNSPDGWMVGVYGSLFADAARGADFGDSPLKIYSLDTIVTLWIVGDELLGEDLLGPFGTISYNLELASITPAPYPYSSVPEPTTILLLGSGILGLAGFRRKPKK